MKKGLKKFFDEVMDGFALMSVSGTYGYVTPEMAQVYDDIMKKNAQQHPKTAQQKQQPKNSP